MDHDLVKHGSEGQENCKAVTKSKEEGLVFFFFNLFWDVKTVMS